MNIPYPLNSILKRGQHVFRSGTILISFLTFLSIKAWLPSSNEFSNFPQKHHFSYVMPGDFIYGTYLLTESEMK